MLNISTHSIWTCLILNRIGNQSSNKLYG
jgi:hypothetical protein